MAIRKQKRVVYKKRINKPKSKPAPFDIKQMLVAFIIGVVTLAILAIFFFRYAAENNYRDILGEQTNITKQSPIEN